MEVQNPSETFQENGIKPETLLQNQDGQEVDVKQQTDMADSLKRSVTLIFWYKPATNPIRLNHHVPTFPLFQLSHFPQLVSELNLSPGSYVDAYNDRTGQWEQHMITTVRSVESEQRLLYKVRQSLFEGLADEECLGLAEELALQLKAKDFQGQKVPVLSGSKSNRLNKSVGSKKRSAPDEQSASAPPAKYHIAEYAPHNAYGVPSVGQTYPQNLSTPNGSMSNGGPMGQPNHMAHVAYAYQQPPSHYGPSLLAMPPPYPPHFQPHQGQPHPHAAQGSGPAPPFHGHPPAVKRWPNDYTVSEVTLGFAQMDGLMSQTPSITQRVAFERVFGTRYVKSTVCRHRGVWKRAGKGVGSMGAGEREMWGDFVRRMEGRRGEIPKTLVVSTENGVAAEGGVVSGVEQLDFNEADGVASAEPSRDQEEEEDGADEEAVMGSLGPPPENLSVPIETA